MLLTFRQVSYWKNTETLFNQNLKAAGENDLAHFNLGSKYLENNRLELALIHLSASAQMNPHDPITYNNLGILYMRQSHDSLAEACFRRAIVLHPEMVQPYFNLAAIKTKQRLFEEATQYMNEVARLAPDDEEARKRLDKLAQALLDLKKGTHEKKR
jgi:Flp pilus assembly protein TadD